jgi:hemolysin III
VRPPTARAPAIARAAEDTVLIVSELVTHAPALPGSAAGQAARTGRCIESDLMPKPDELIIDIAALVESGQTNRMSLTVVTGGAVITGRLAPEAVWRQRVSEVLTDSADLGEFSDVFDTPAKKDGPPTHLHFHVARILQGTVGIPETGGMFRVAIEDVNAWTVGDFSYSDH